MPEFAYVIRPTRLDMLSRGPTPHERAIIAQHFEYLQMLVQEGRALLVGRTLTDDEHAFGIMIFRADDEAAAVALAEADPAVVHGLMRLAVYPFKIVLLSSTWSTT